MHGTARNGSEWHGKDEKGQDSKDKNLLWKGEGVGEGGSKCGVTLLRKAARVSAGWKRKGGIARGLRGGIKYFNHRLSCYRNAFDPDSKALL